MANSHTVFKESNSDFYDLEYFLSLEYRYLSGAHGSKVRNIFSLIGKTIGDHSKKRVLDVGCGNGFYAGEFSKLGANVTGIDYSQHAITFAKDRHPGIDFRIMSGYSLKDFPDNEFDIVTLFDVIEHMSDQVHVLNEIKRILKPSGFLIVSTDADESIWLRPLIQSIVRRTEYFSKEGRAYRLIKRVESRRKQYRNYHSSHINELSSTELHNLLKKSGFSIMARRVYPLVGVPIRDFFLRFLPESYRGDHQCVIAQRIND